MPIELADTVIVPKPWGVSDLRPWRDRTAEPSPIGEIWYERSERSNPDPSLRLKLLFTSEPLSIQVHPDEVYARRSGLPHGKTEAWYVLSATPDARVALGLKHRMDSQQLRQAVADGSISSLIDWKHVSAGEAIFVPAGTIHSIGAGLVIAEVQQRSDATFRMFDHGRQRELHIEDAIAVADAGPADIGAQPSKLSAERSLLISTPYFVLERVDLPPESHWRLEAERETWLLFLKGKSIAGSIKVATGDAIFAESSCVNLEAGPTGTAFLAAYAGADMIPNFLEDLKDARQHSKRPLQEAPTSN